MRAGEASIVSGVSSVHAPRCVVGAAAGNTTYALLGNGMPTVPFFPKPSFGRIMSQPEHPMNVTEIRMVVHLGTHVDAPKHFFSDGPALHEIPLQRDRKSTRLNSSH